METRTPGDRDPLTPGTAEVHTRVTTGATGGTTAGSSTPGAGTGSMGGGTTGGSSSGSGGMMDDAKGRAQDAASQVKDRAQSAADTVRERAGEVTSQAQERAGEALQRAEQALEESGVLRYVRDNPLPVLGVAFGLGYLLAGSSDTGGTFGKAKHQIRGAIMGGLSAAIANEARSFVGMSGSSGGGGGLSSLLQGLTGGGSSSGQGGGSSTSSRNVHREPSHQEMS